MFCLINRWHHLLLLLQGGELAKIPQLIVKLVLLAYSNKSKRCNLFLTEKQPRSHLYYTKHQNYFLNTATYLWWIFSIILILTITQMQLSRNVITLSESCTLSINFSGNLAILQFIQFCLLHLFSEFTFLVHFVFSFIPEAFHCHVSLSFQSCIADSTLSILSKQGALF